MTQYLLHGLRMSSDIRLPEPPGWFDGPADLEVRASGTGPVERVPDECVALRHALDADTVRYEGFRDTDGDWVIRSPGIVDIRLHGASASVRLDPGADPELAPMFAAGMGIAFFLAVSGHLCLHASAVEADGLAVALSAPSGYGKSTLAALAAAAGHPLVGDDLLRVTFDGPAPAVYRGASEIRLRPGAAELLQHWPGHSRMTADGRTAVAPPVTRIEQVPLAAMVFPVLELDRPGVAIERLRPSDALVPLLGCPRLVGWRDHSVLARQFEQLATLAAEVPVLIARVPWRTPAQPTLGAALMEGVLEAL
ncbi:MAG: hypothetical protein JWL73_3270 [Actinomycetia bacterium]|nr:hypothetical protein [Actinomycetes bacterium]